MRADMMSARKCIRESVDSFFDGISNWWEKISHEWNIAGCAHRCGCSDGTKEVFKEEIESYGPRDPYGYRIKYRERIYKTVTCEKCRGSGLSGEACDIVDCPRYYSFEENYLISAKTVARSS